MSVTSLCTGSTVIKQTMTHSIGASGGDVATPTDGEPMDCRFEEMSADEAIRYDARGERSLFAAYFAADPSFAVDDRLKLTVWANVTLGTPKLCRVLGQKMQANPRGNLVLWIVHCEEVTQRFEEDS